MSLHALVPGGSCLDHGQSKEFTCAAAYPCTDPYSTANLRCFSCAIHNPWKCVHDIDLQMYIWTMRLCSCIHFSSIIWLIQIGILNSWLRSFCRTRFQKRRDSAAELHDTLFAEKLSSWAGSLGLCLSLQYNAHSFGSRSRLDFQPPRECQHDS